MIQNFLNFISTCSNSEFYNFLTHKELIYDQMLCTFCNSSMVIKKTKDCKIGLVWRCLNYSCTKYLTSASIYKRSFFSYSRVDPRTILTIIFYLSENELISKIESYTSINKKSIIKIKKKIFKYINRYWIENPIKLGGLDTIVQIDETKLNFNIKSHRGRSPRDAVWAITMVDTSTQPSKGYIEIVPNRTRNTLCPIIERVIRTGSIIYTDEWSSYSQLSRDNNYEHYTVCHKYNFVNPKNNVHIQNVESFNNKIKYEIKKRKGIRNEEKTDFLNYFLFLDHFRKKPFYLFLALINL